MLGVVTLDSLPGTDSRFGNMAIDSEDTAVLEAVEYAHMAVHTSAAEAT